MRITTSLHRSLHRGHLPLFVAGLALLAVAPACQKSVVAPSQSKITLTAGSTAITSNGATTLTALVLDQNGNAVQDGTAVDFVTTLGLLQPSQSNTRHGQASTQLSANKQLGTATVTATSGSNTSEPVTVTFVAPLGVAITTQPTSPVVNAVVNFTATVTPATGGPAVDHFAWDFGDGKTATTSTGTTSHVYTTTGTMVVKATLTAVDGSTSLAQIELIVVGS